MRVFPNVIALVVLCSAMVAVGALVIQHHAEQMRRLHVGKAMDQSLNQWSLSNSVSVQFRTAESNKTFKLGRDAGYVQGMKECKEMIEAATKVIRERR